MVDVGRALAALEKLSRLAPLMDAALEALGRKPGDAFAEHDFRIALDAFNSALSAVYERPAGQLAFFVPPHDLLGTAHNAGWDALVAADKRDVDGFRAEVRRLDAALTAFELVSPQAAPVVEATPPPGPPAVAHPDDALGELLYNARISGMQWDAARSNALKAGFRKLGSDMAATKIMDAWCKRRGIETVRTKGRKRHKQ